MHALDGTHLGEERDIHLPAVGASAALFPTQGFQPPDHESVCASQNYPQGNGKIVLLLLCLCTSFHHELVCFKI